MKTCPYCRSSLPDYDITCKNCGANLPYVAPPPPKEPPSSDTYVTENNTTIVYMNADDSPNVEIKKQKNSPGCIAIVIAFFLIGGLINTIISAFNPAPVSPSTSSSDTVVATETVTPSEAAIDSNIEKIMTVAGLTESEANAVFNHLKSVGFTSISTIEKVDLKQNKGVDIYFASCNDIEVIIGLANKITRAIYANDIYLYTDQEGVLYQAADRCITVPIYLKFIDLSKELINTRLASSSKLEYAKTDDWTITRNMDLVTTKGSVDSKNKKGKSTRSTFTIEYSYKTKKPFYISINGKTVYGKPYAAAKKKN